MRPESNSRSTRTFRIILGLGAAFVLFAFASFSTPTRVKVRASQDVVPETTHTVFSNSSSIACADRVSNTAGTNPGLPPLYPSPIVVSGLSGNVSKVTVTFPLTSTFPDDADILLIGPTGARSLVMSDAGGSGDHTAVSFTFDQTAAGLMPDGPTTPIPSGTFQPSNYVGLAAPEPGGQDNFPAPGPGLLSYTTDFNVFNGTAPNGTWSLYVVDDQVIDLVSLPSGWSIDITTSGPTGCTAADRPLDFDGNGTTDLQVVRNTGGGPSGQVTWYTSPTPTQGQAIPWGIATDSFVPGDYDGDSKTDVAVWRSGPPFNAYFHILQSASNTLRSVPFGQANDDPSVIGDYDGDGRIDPAVYRGGLSPGDHSFWYYFSSVSSTEVHVEWGQSGDFPAPGDYDGDGRFDFVVQRNAGGGQAAFFQKLSSGTQISVIHGTPTDIIVPGYYDADCKTDIAIARSSGGNLEWWIRKSTDGSLVLYVFGTSATDFRAQGDYDGDGFTDPAVWRPNADPSQNFFFWLRSTTGTLGSAEWGQNGDYPTANFNSH